MSRISSPPVMYAFAISSGRWRDGLDEVGIELLQARARRVGAIVMHVVVIGEHLRGVRVAHLVLHERGEDVAQHGLRGAPVLLAKELTRQALDHDHVGEVLDDRDLVVLRQGARLSRPIEIADAPLIAPAFLQHLL